VTPSARPRVLIAEDDQDIASLLAHTMRRGGYDAEIVGSGGEVIPRVTAAPPSVLLLDLMLPEVSGLDICRALRARAEGAHLPIIMITALGDEPQRIGGLDAGADDYVTKPFSPREVLARVRALLRRSAPPAGSSPLLQYGTITMDVERHVVSAGGREVRLTAKEFLLLQYFLEHPGRVLSRDVLLADVWGYTYTGGTRTVDVHVRRLREKLPALNDAILTVKQFGYRLLEPAP
jgi:DNA-binding response OmpR family regulator